MSTDLERVGPLVLLDPKQRLALEYYTNPLYGRSFGNMSVASKQAGYSTSKVFHTEDMKAAIAHVYALQEETSEEASNYLARHNMAAAFKLVQQMGMDDGLQVKPMPDELLDTDPAPIMGVDSKGNEKLLGFDTGKLQRAKEITAHNKAVAAIMRETRNAVLSVLAYNMGTPEQKVSVEHGRKGAKDPLNLGDLDNEQLRLLARNVNDMLEATSVEVLDSEDVVEDEPNDSGQSESPSEGEAP